MLQRVSNEWVPVFGRLDVASKGLVKVPDCENLGAVRVIAERLSGADFLARIHHALEGEPFVVCKEPIAGHRIEEGFSATRRHSSDSPDPGIQWPVLELQSRHNLDLAPELWSPIESRTSDAVYENLDDVIRQLSGYEPYHGLKDGRRNRVTLHLWDERARIKKVEIEGRHLVVESDVADRTGAKVLAGVSMEPGERARLRKLPAEPRCVFDLEGEPFRTKVTLRLGEEDVDVRWIEREMGNKTIDSESSLETVVRIVERFPSTVRVLGYRAQERQPYQVSDEQDLQDLLYAVLVATFDEVERETTTPKFAGGSGRVDLLLRKESVGIEVKFVRGGRPFRKIREELFREIPSYLAYEDCKSLVVMIYDPEGRVDNPEGVKRDLEGLVQGRVHVRIVA